MSVAGIVSMGIHIPMAVPISLIASLLEKPAAMSLAGRRSEITELISELEVRIPVMGSADDSRGLNWRFGFLNFPPFTKYHTADSEKDTR